MYPTFRPDKAYAVEGLQAYRDYLEQLGSAAGIHIQTFDDLLEALQKRVLFFDSLGCRASDHGLEYLYFDRDSERAAPALFSKLLKGNPLEAKEIVQFKGALLLNLCTMYSSQG